MLLFITATHEGVYYEDISFCISDYEEAFAVLTQLVVKRWLLQQATIIDGMGRLNLSVAAFDGQPVQRPMQTLQHQWQQILAGSPASFHSGTTPALKEWHRQLEAYYEKVLGYLAQMILWLEVQQSRSRLMDNQAVGHRLQEQYASLLVSNRRMLQQTQEKHHHNRQRLRKFAH